MSNNFIQIYQDIFFLNKHASILIYSQKMKFFFFFFFLFYTWSLHGNVENLLKKTHSSFSSRAEQKLDSELERHPAHDRISSFQPKLHSHRKMNPASNTKVAACTKCIIMFKIFHYISRQTKTDVTASSRTQILLHYV